MKNTLRIALFSLPVIFIGSCYLGSFHPVFCLVGLVSCGAILGACGLAGYRDLMEEQNDSIYWQSDSRFNANQIHSLISADRNDMAMKLKEIFRKRGAEDIVSDDQPDVIRVVNDNLWLVVNNNPELLAFKDPDSPGETLVFKSDFAMRALALGFLPEVKISDNPRKRRIQSTVKRGKC